MALDIGTVNCECWRVELKFQPVIIAEVAIILLIFLVSASSVVLFLRKGTVVLINVAFYTNTLVTNNIARGYYYEAPCTVLLIAQYYI